MTWFNRILGAIVTLMTVASFALAQPVQTISRDSRLNSGIAINKSGEIFVATNGGNGVLNGRTIYKVARDGSVEEYITGLNPFLIELDFDQNDNLYVTNWNTGVYRITPEKEVSLFIPTAQGVNGLEIDTLTNTFYIMNWFAHTVSRVDGAGTTVTTVASGGSIRFPAGLAFDQDTGNLYVANWFDGRITKILPDGSQSLFGTLPVPFNTGMPACMVVGDYLYVTSYALHQIFRAPLEPGGALTPFAGLRNPGTVDGELLQAQFISPGPMAASLDGDTLFVTQDSLATGSGGGNGTLRMIILPDDTPTSIRQGNTATPAGFGLAPNYPNPFNPGTVVRFELPKAAAVSLNIFDITGRLIHSLVEVKQTQPGLHEVYWDGKIRGGRQAASGVYFLQMVAEGFRDTRKITLMQ